MPNHDDYTPDFIYLDHAATTPVPKEVADAMYNVLSNYFGNPSSQYPMGFEMKKQLESWRKIIADALGCDAKHFYFTSCGTESDNWAISAACWQNRHLGRHIITSSIEHSAVLQTCKWLEKQGYEITWLKPAPDGAITANQVLDAVRPDTALVSLMLVNNELGNLYPIQEIARGLSAKNPKTLLHTDAVQGFLKIPFQATQLGADFVSISAHKIGGPKGIGGLYIDPKVRNPKPLIAGGMQENNLRAGTEATAQIAGFAKAVEIRYENLDGKLQHIANIRAYAVERLLEIPSLCLTGGGDAPHILSISLEGWPSQNIVNDLGSQGICISAGSACHQGKPSHVIKALELPKKIAHSVIRLSFGPETTTDEIDACVNALRRHRDTRLPML